MHTLPAEPPPSRRERLSRWGLWYVALPFGASLIWTVIGFGGGALVRLADSNVSWDDVAFVGFLFALAGLVLGYGLGRRLARAGSTDLALLNDSDGQ